MDDKENVFFAFLGAATLAAFALTRGVPPSRGLAAELNYRTTCSFEDNGDVDGFVTNLSANAYRARGEARFRFENAGSLSRREVLVPVDGRIPPGQTVRVARTRLAFMPRGGETCAFDAKEAIVPE